jgi:hypothetical protein
MSQYTQIEHIVVWRIPASAGRHSPKHQVDRLAKPSRSTADGQRRNGKVTYPHNEQIKHNMAIAPSPDLRIVKLSGLLPADRNAVSGISRQAALGFPCYCINFGTTRHAGDHGVDAASISPDDQDQH